MGNKIKAQNQHGVAWPMTFAALMANNTLVRITANETVNAAAATHRIKGYVVKTPQTTAEKGTVMLNGRAVVEIKMSADLAAGVEVKMAALSGSDQQIAAFVEGTDAQALCIGWVLKGGTSGNLALVVLY